MKTVYLHIGYHKTGTTAIQGLLSANEQALRERGILYPRSCRAENTPDLTTSAAFAHHRLPLDIVDGNTARPEELRDEIAGSPCETAIVSTEVFMEKFKTEAEHFETLRRLFEDFTVKIIIYLRPQDTLYESVYNQQIKDSFVPPPFNPTVLPPYYNYLRWVRLWGQYFGDANIIVRPYEKVQFAGGSLFSDFLSAVGANIRLEDLEPPPAGTNPRLSRDTLLFKRIVNQLDIEKNVKNACNGPLLRISQQQEPQTTAEFREHGLLTPVERRAITKKYQAENSTIAREYLGRTDGKLFGSKPPASDVADAPADRNHLRPEAAAAIADGLLLALRPDLGSTERQEQLTFEIVKSAVSLLNATPTTSSTKETVENLQALVNWQQRALDKMRARHADALYKIAQLTEAVADKKGAWPAD